MKPSRTVTTETAHCKDVGSEEAHDEREREREMSVDLEHLELAGTECLFPRLPDSNLL